MPCMNAPVEEQNYSYLQVKEFGQMFCQVCKLLTKDQMLAIKPAFPKLYKNLLDWYSEHLKQDYDRTLVSQYGDNEVSEFVKSEVKRLKIDIN